MKLRGEDTDEGLRDWFRAELKEGPKQGYDLGKFFFSASLGTIGALAALEKLNHESRVDLPLLISVALLFVSILVALNLALPRKVLMGGETELEKEYEEQVDYVINNGRLWFVLWLLGTLLGAWAVRS